MSIRTRRNFLKYTGLGAAGMMLSGCNRTSKAPPPNILLIMSDDHATQAMSAYGSNRNVTPYMDRIAREGMRFTLCFAVNAICGPSRAAILSGKYGHITGFRRNSLRFDVTQQTFPRLLQDAGYQTGLFGKWHLSHNDAKNPPVGFDQWTILPGQGKYFNPEMFEMGVRKQFQGYVTDIVTDMSLDFLKNRDKNRPFLLMCHHKAPHSPWEYDEKHADLYADEEIPEPETFWDDYSTRSNATKNASRSPLATLARSMQRPNWATGPLDVQGSTDPKTIKKLVYQKFLKEYLRSVAAVDDNIGRLLAYLDEEGIAEETIVIYTSDQGFFLGEHGWHNKRFFYEEAIRMPLVIRYPGEIAAGDGERRHGAEY